MTKQISVQLVDDLDGSEASETVRFACDGVSYEIDLNAGNADKFREMMREYVSHARRTGGVSVNRTHATGMRKEADPMNTVIREWALEQGHVINGHGRIPARIRAMYEAVHANDA